MIYAIVALVLVVVYVIATYNKMVTIRTQIEASIQEIGNQLKRQMELIPNLESSAGGYLKHEKGIFKSLTDARKAVENAFEDGGVKALQSAETAIGKVLPKIQVLVESNPEIKGTQVVEKLMNELRDTSDKVMYSRRTLIDLSQDLNQMLVVFPSSIVASIFGIKPEKGLQTPKTGRHMEVSEEDTETPKVSI